MKNKTEEKVWSVKRTKQRTFKWDKHSLFSMVVRTLLYNHSICSHLKLRAKHFYFSSGSSLYRCDWASFHWEPATDKDKESERETAVRWKNKQESTTTASTSTSASAIVIAIVTATATQHQRPTEYYCYYSPSKYEKWIAHYTRNIREMNLFGPFDQKRICKAHHIATSFTE